MSIARDWADVLPQQARAQDSESPPGSPGERRVEAPEGILKAGPTETEEARAFTYIWQLFGYAIVDRSGAKVGPIARIWTDTASGQLKFIGLTTGRLRRQTYVIPAHNARIDDHARSMTVHYRAAVIRRAPHHNSDVSLKTDQERKVYDHYGNS